MQRLLQRGVLIGMVLLFFIPESSDAQLLRRRRRYAATAYNVVTTPLRAVARPIAGLIRQRSGLDRNEYNYNWAARRDWHNEDAEPMLFADKVRVNLLLRDEDSQRREQLKVRARWVYMHKSQTEHTAWLDIAGDGDQPYFELPGLEEGRVVKVRSDFYISTDEPVPNQEALESAAFVQNDQGTYKFVGSMHVPYYGVTSSVNNEEYQRRARIVSFSFSQWYVDEAFGGRYCDYDCYSFYQTSASGELEGFSLQQVANSNVPAMSTEGKRFHGDYLIMPGHYGMALCYDEDTGNFCTIEGNYALNGPYRVNIDPYYHGLYTWSSIMTITEDESEESSL